jgi:hypothetical protein
MKLRRTRKPQPVRAKRGGKSAAKPSRSRSAPLKKEQKDFIDSLIDASAQALGLTIDPAWRDGVKFHLQLVLSHAARVDEFSLPDESEPAPVFHA